MEVLFLVKIFNIEFFRNLYVLRFSESKNVVYGNRSVCVCDCVRNVLHFMFQKLIKVETPNFTHNTRLVHR